MDHYRPSQLPSASSSFLPSSFDNEEIPDPSSNQMKAPKRKRLAKACDACHKSKRRCDGTAPCSNCYYASKPCTYTDASGRPVPAPRPFKTERPDNEPRALQPSTSNNPLPPPQDVPEDEALKSQNTNLSQNSNPRKKFRNELGNAVPTEHISSTIPVPVMDPAIAGTIDRPIPPELDHSLTRELTNLFFTHCHPARVIIHKPTFSANLAHNRVPLHLVHAVCALAAPLSKQPRIRTTPSRIAGKRFAQEAMSLMFDGAGRLVCERNLATAQALCLLQVHDLRTKDENMSYNSRFHDLAMQLIEQLNVYQHDYPTLTPVPSPEFIQASIEREAVRRIFWLIHCMDVMASVLFKKPMEPLNEYGMRLRLPADETSFELGVHSTLPEYLYLRAVKTQYASEFGHLIRVVTIYAKVEGVIEELDDPDLGINVEASLHEAERMMDYWAGSLSDHLRFSEQSLQVQQSMFETSSNAGAWCWCCMHVFHASCLLALNTARQRLQKPPKSDTGLALKTVDLIMDMLGDRAKHSIIMGAALWAFIRYCKRDDAQIQAWLADYEDCWGTRMLELATRGYPPLSPQQQYPSNCQQPPNPQQAHHQPLPHTLPNRRIADVRNPPISSARPSSHQHDSSFNRRSPNSSSPTLVPVGRQIEELRIRDVGGGSGGHNRNSSLQSQLNPSHSDRDSGRGLSISGTTNVGMGLTHGGNIMEREREHEGNPISHLHVPPIRHSIRDTESDPGMQDGANGARAGNGANENDSMMPGQVPRAMGSGHITSGDGPQSLPSLKSVGLLAVQHQVSMPVGLQWLANESR